MSNESVTILKKRLENMTKERDGLRELLTLVHERIKQNRIGQALVLLDTLDRIERATAPGDYRP